jgi:hypothetical protein
MDEEKEEKDEEEGKGSVRVFSCQLYGRHVPVVLYA